MHANVRDAPCHACKGVDRIISLMGSCLCTRNATMHIYVLCMHACMNVQVMTELDMHLPMPMHTYTHILHTCLMMNHQGIICMHA